VKKLILTPILILFSLSALSQLPYTEDFESGSGGFTTSISECSDGGGDYFIITDGSTVSGTYNGALGSYFAAQDIDAAGCPAAAGATASVTISGIDIIGCTGLTISIDLAEDDDGANQDWDAGDFLHIEASIDGGGSQNLIWVEGQGGFNTAPFIDTDFDGTGDGTEITSSFQTFTNAIAGTGNSLTITITIQLDSGDEDIALDNIIITGTGCAGCPGPDTEPTNEATGSAVTNISCNTADISWTNGADATNSLVVISTSAVTGVPSDGTAYNANAVYGSGDVLNAGEFVIYNGTGGSVSVSGLADGTTYFITIFEYNGTINNCEENYLTGGTTLSFTTATGCINQSPQIESILYNSCNGANEGTDEIFTFITGSDPLEVDSINIDYPNGSSYCNVGCGANTNLNNPSYINDLNTMAGCTVFAYADPIPPNSSVMVFTGNPPSTVLDYSSQCGAADLPIYVIFNNNTSTSGRFSNTEIRTLIVSFGNGQADTVTYDGSAQASVDGATVNFDEDGNPTYFISTDCVYPLPIQLIYFNGNLNGPYTKLNWATASERNNDYYTIEKSLNGYNFITIGTVNGGGNKSILSNYEFIDLYPLNEIAYYRIKQIDYDGKFQYSHGIRVSNSNNSIYYSSQQINIIIDTKTRKSYTVNIYNLSGQLIHMTSIEQSQHIDWNKYGFFIIEIPELQIRQKLFCN
jgi:hypothetical protein